MRGHAILLFGHLIAILEQMTVRQCVTLYWYMYTSRIYIKIMFEINNNSQ